MRLAHNFPGMTSEMARLDLGEKPNGKAAERTLRDLHRGGFLDVERDGHQLRYHLPDRGIEPVVRMDKSTHKDYRGRALSDSWVTRQDRRAHESGAMNMITDFMAGGLAVAPGWRGSVYMGKRVIKPDGLVRLNSSPYGPRWGLLEYELSARSLRRVTAKLRGYAALLQPGQVVLVVCFDDKAESVFHHVGDGMNLPMITTTVKRIKQHGPLGNFGCWAMYGEPVRIG